MFQPSQDDIIARSYLRQSWQLTVGLTRGLCCVTGNYSAGTTLCYHQILKIIFIFLLACVRPLPSSECRAGKQHCSRGLRGDTVPPHRVSCVGEEKEAGNKASSLNSLGKKKKIKWFTTVSVWTCDRNNRPDAINEYSRSCFCLNNRSLSIT